MQEVTFTLRTLTPLFLAGADQTQAELRAPTFRGLMRYWYRALVGGVAGTDTKGLEKIMHAEAALFGATDTGSAVAIKVSAASHEPRRFDEQVSHKIGGKWQATGKGYLLWSMVRSGRPEKGNVKEARWYFPPGTSFKVTLSTRNDNDQKLKQAVAAFWLLTHLGSVGSRARRCAGSLTAQLIGEYSTDFAFNQPENAQALKQQLEQGIKAARMLGIQVLKRQSEQEINSARVDYDLERTFIKEARFDSLTRGVCRIWILQEEQPWASPDIAMQKIGEKLQDYRSHVSMSERKIFGLPLPPIIFNKRRASPLLLRIAELRGNKYVGIAVLFKTTGGDIAMRDYAVIEKWINEFRGMLEVSL